MRTLAKLMTVNITIMTNIRNIMMVSLIKITIAKITKTKLTVLNDTFIGSDQMWY